MDILDFFLDILLKPPQPLMGLFFSIKGEIFHNSLSNLGTDILYMLKNFGTSVSSPDKEYKTLLCLISAHSRDEPTSFSS